MKSILNIPVPSPSSQSNIKRKASVSFAPSESSTGEVWGRHAKATHWDAIYAASVMLFCPLIVILCYTTIHHFNGSLTQTAWSFVGAVNDGTISQWCGINLPQPSKQGFAIYGCWLVFQALLFIGLPGKAGRGQITPAGHLLTYKVNGLLAWTVSVALFIGGGALGLYRPSIVARTWGPLLVAANAYGYALTAVAYLKAHYAPTHVRDNKYSGSRLYDIYMGVEFNPRITDAFDFKLFHNGRPGIIAWSIINISFAAQQFENTGRVSLGMLGVNLLQAIYVLDFFYNEDWYLRTIDIAHDHFGFYLAWGDSVWLPQMYTLQGQYLSYRSDNLPTEVIIAIVLFGLAGYWLFRSANHQKDLARKTAGDCMIWGQKPEMIEAEYLSTDGEQHKSLLLCSGWWGVVRHANYLGDLIQAFAMCAICGFHALVPFSYLIFMSILLLHRTSRDNARCQMKYGNYWIQYKRRVPWTLIPALF